MKLIHTRQQIPIGQGFFHSGSVSFEGTATPIQYVYDCGSTNRRRLRRQICDFVEEEEETPLDFLFLSHFDSDHVCGLDQLLVLRTAKVAVAPYLSPTARWILAAKAASSGDLDGSYLSLLCDPTGWLLDRGVEDVIYVTSGPPPQGEADSFTTPPDPDQSLLNVRREKVKATTDEVPYILDAENLKVDADARRPNGSYRSSCKVISCTQPLRLKRNGWDYANWQFVTFVHPEGEREEIFRNVIRRVFGRTLIHSRRFEINQSELMEVLRSSNERSKLASCYEVIRKNHNLTSLSLYSGPIDFSNMHVTEASPFLSIEPRIAWLGTGDSNLKTNSRRMEFLDHYSGLLPFVYTMSLPHHGSRNNFHGELLRASLRFVAAAGLNRSKHPHPSVVAQISPHRLHVTTEDAASVLFERFVLDDR